MIFDAHCSNSGRRTWWSFKHQGRYYTVTCYLDGVSVQGPLIVVNNGFRAHHVKVRHANLSDQIKLIEWLGEDVATAIIKRFL
jgi:hypothetical protein